MRTKVEREKVCLKLNIQKIKIMASSPITSWQIDGETMETVTYFIFLGSKITADGDCSHEIKRLLLLGRKARKTLDSVLKSRGITLPTKVNIVKVMVFPIVMYRCESWTIKKTDHRRIDAFKLVLEKSLESSLDSKEIKPANPEGSQPWIFIGRTDVEAEASVFWPPDPKSHLFGKDLDAGKYWRQKEKAVTEDEVVRQHQWLNGHKFE